MPPDGPETIIGEGVGLGGERWILGTRWQGTDLYTGLRILDHAERPRWGGGMGGPPLYPGALTNQLTGSNGVDGPQHLIIRAATSIASISVTLSNGTRTDLELMGTAADLGGVHVAALVYQRELDIHRIDFHDVDGHAMPRNGPSG